MITLTEEQITELAQTAIEAAKNDKQVDGRGWTYCDAVCLPIQERLEVESGDLAAILWDGYEDQWDSQAAVERYIRGELNFKEEQVGIIAESMWQELQLRCEDEEMFLGWMPEGADITTYEGDEIVVKKADQDYYRITDGGCTEQFLIPLKDCLNGSIVKAIAPVVEWYEANPV